MRYMTKMNRRLNLTNLPDELLIKIMQGGPTTCDGIPKIEVWVSNGAISGSHMTFKITTLRPFQLKPFRLNIDDDVLQVMRRDVAKWAIIKDQDKRSVKRGAGNDSRQLFIANIMLPEVPKAQFEAMAAQASTRFIRYIATALEEIGKKYGLHVRKGRASGTATAIFYLCGGGNLAQANQQLYRLR